MKKEERISLSGYFISGIILPKNNWTMNIGGQHGFTIHKETAPCWFHRKMQSIFLGITYTRIK